MSWSIYAYGTKVGVQKKIEDATINESSPDIEKNQFEKVKELLLASLVGFEDSQGFRMEANGSTSITDDSKLHSNNCLVKIETFEYST